MKILTKNNRCSLSVHVDCGLRCQLLYGKLDTERGAAAAAAAAAGVAVPADGFTTMLIVTLIVFQQQSWRELFATLLQQAAAW